MSQISRNLYKKLQKQYSRRINLDLKRIKKVLQKLNNPQEQVHNVINIIGSDGKNSVLTSLKYFLEANKEKVNTFTSPHLYDVRQRFWLGDRFISINEIKKYKQLIEKTKVKLTLFELLTCIYVLSAKNTDNTSFNLIESGLLFKKDSTNLWETPIAQIVTNINYQHQEWVHPKTIKEICNQKVGFLSKNSNIYVGKQELNTQKLIKKILIKNTSEKLYYGEWKIIKLKNKRFYKDKQNLIKLISKNIFSDGLWDNVGLAIKVALDLGVKPKIIKKTVPKIKFEGRMNYIKGKLTKNKNYKILVDGCHSDTSTKNLANHLRKIKVPIYGIWGCLKNKNPEKLIRNFQGNFKKLVTIKIPDEPNSSNPDELKRIAVENGFNSTSSRSIRQALNSIPKNKRCIVVIFGSLYLAGHVLRIN